MIGGTHSVLVVETGMGPRNAEKVLTFAAGYASGRRLYLTGRGRLYALVRVVPRRH